ncbi:LysR family transcriptional regulator [Streptomyces sp. 7R007]
MLSRSKTASGRLLRSVTAPTLGTPATHAPRPRADACRKDEATGPTRPPASICALRCFVPVAGHRPFGRAAAPLRPTQPTLSRQMRRLKRYIRMTLLPGTPGRHAHPGRTAQDRARRTVSGAWG